ncbi:hypothetical protein ACFCX4_18610 [Kitasatospora sp. NPDC056327]|uniref:hypothetical protein n=1 Tax=Kitasatospora sp. NPDC056327 TaxID=3345785 RepID=UPI0035D8C101
MSSTSEQMTGVRVRDLVRDVVAACAPGEVVIVEGLLRQSDAQVLARLRRRRGERDPLGFGLAEIVPLVAPMLWLTLERARERIAQNLVDGASRGTATLWQRMRRRPPVPEVIPPLIREQQRLVHTMVFDAAVEAGLSPDLARRIADGVVAGLVLADPDEPQDRSAEQAEEDGAEEPRERR